MAIQNFISGGFYGKIGDLVGQRWRNKRIVRRHVIGRNPRTELQQQNRSLFAQSVSLAQFAMNINKGVPAWDNEAIGEFSWRVGVAKLRLRNGLSESVAIPLFPDNYVPYHSFTDAFLLGPEIADNHKFSLTPSPPVGSRHFSAAIYCQNLLTGEWETLYLRAQLPATTPCYFEPALSTRYGFPAGGWIIGATYDDRENSGNMYFLPKKEVFEDDPPIRHYLGSFVDITWFSDHFEALYTTPNTTFEDPGPIPVTLYCRYNGVMRNVPGLGTLTWLGGKNWKITGPRAANIQYPEDSSIAGLFYEDPRAYYLRLIEMESVSIQEP